MLQCPLYSMRKRDAPFGVVVSSAVSALGLVNVGFASQISRCEDGTQALIMQNKYKITYVSRTLQDE